MAMAVRKSNHSNTCFTAFSWINKLINSSNTSKAHDLYMLLTEFTDMPSKDMLYIAVSLC